MREKYKLLKDVHWGKAGSILEAKCDDGTQDFKVIQFVEHPCLKGKYSIDAINVSRIVVEKNKEFFEQVYPVYVTKEETKKVEKFLAGK